MRTNKIFATLILALFGWLACAVTQVQAATGGDPVGMLQNIADNMIAGLKQNKATLKSKPSIVYNLAYRYVVPYADLDLMSQRVIPPQTWNNATPAQRAQFKKEFTRTLIRTYASALTSYEDQTIRFYPVRGGQGNTVEVKSLISGSQGDPISVVYRLVRSGGGWKLLDMSVEGVDMLDSFRSQFSSILSSGSMDELLRRMSAHNG
jgi:phospholipid transport system substrate-binding protein